MRFPKKTQIKISKKAYFILPAIAVAAAIVWGVLGSATAASPEPSVVETNSSYVLVDTEVKKVLTLNIRTNLCNLTLNAPTGAYLISDAVGGRVSYTAANAGNILCAPGDKMYWSSGQSSITASNAVSSGYTTLGQERTDSYTTTYAQSNFLMLSSSPDAYYFVSDRAHSMDEFLIELKRLLAAGEFADYIYPTETEEKQFYIQMPKDGDYINSVLSSLDSTMYQAVVNVAGTAVYDQSMGVTMENLKDGQVLNVVNFSAEGITRTLRKTTTERDEYGVVIDYRFQDRDQWMMVPMFAVSNYTVQMKQEAAIPTVVTDLGDSIPNREFSSVFKDTEIQLQFGDENKEGLELCYFQSSTVGEYEALSRLDSWTVVEPGESIPLDSDNDYVFFYAMVRSSADDAEDYFSGAYAQPTRPFVCVFRFDKGQLSASGTELTIESGESYVDLGDKVTLSDKANPTALLYYTVDGTRPELVRFKGDRQVTLQQLEEAAAGQSNAYITDITGTSNYMKLNGYWYSCQKSVRLYDSVAGIEVDEEIRAQNRLLVRVFEIKEGLEPGTYVTLPSVPYQLRSKIETPGVDIPTTEETPTELQMGEAINFSSTEFGAEIYYTTNGSAPVVTTQENAAGTVVTVPGNSTTYKADGSVTISEDFAAYGSNVTFMVKAVLYDGAYRLKQDSEVVRFVYHIGNQSPVEVVQAVPQTDASSPAEITTGSIIMLHSKTSNTTIYYTTDGTEPVRNSDGTTAENTYTYNAAQGIIVPTQEDSLFTITAMAYAPGLATSDIVRFVYRYPPAVSTPYATPGSGMVTENTIVNLRTSTSDAVIYYEIAYDGAEPEDPTESSSVFDQLSPITITRETKIKAMAVLDDVASTVNEFEYTVSSKLSVPVPSLQNGAVTASGTNITLSADSGASVYYTTDGSNPADSANTNVNVGNTVFLEGTPGSVITIRAYAVKTGFSNSEIANYSYTISNYANAIFADKESGTVLKNGDTITLNTDVTGAAIYYTTNGTTPTTASTRGNVVTVSGASGSTLIINAIAVVDGTTRSAAMANFTYTITEKLKAPQSNVPSGAIFTERSSVTLTAEAGTIYYTTDGSVPTESSSVYGAPITITRTTTIRAIAIAPDTDASDISTFSYQLAGQVATPEASHDSGQLDVGTEVSLTCEDSEAVIYYTTNGTDPDTDNPGALQTYTGPITVNQPMTLKAVAVQDGMQESTVLTVGYTVKEPIVVEEETGVVDPVTEAENTSGRLQSRRTYEGGNTGPSFEDIILKNATYGVLVASSFDVIPDNTQLTVNRTQIDTSSNNLVKQNLGENYNIVSSYDVTLTSEGVEVQPDGEIEIGLPIPSEYENALIYVVHVADDGSIEIQETRRGAGMAYAKVNHLSQYSIVAPDVTKSQENNIWRWILVGTLVVVVIAAGTVVIIRRRRKYYDR